MPPQMRAVARSELLYNLRNVRSLVIIVILPVLLLILYGYGINYDLENIPFAVYDLDGGRIAREVTNQFTRSRYFSMTEAIADRRRIDALLDRGDVSFVLVIPPDLGRRIGAGRQAQVQVIVDGADTIRANVAVGYISKALVEYSQEVQATFLQRIGRSAPTALEPRVTILYNPDLDSNKFIVPGLIAVLLTILAALLTSTCIVREREWGSFEALASSPAPRAHILVGKMLPYVGIAFLDVLLSIAAGAAIFGVAPAGSISFLIAASILYLLASLAIGVLFSVLAGTQRLAILMAVLTTLLPTVLLSDFAFPIRSMPAALRILSNIIPATHFLVVIRSIYLKAAGPAVLWQSVLALAVFTIAAMAIARAKFRKRLR